MFSCTYFIVDTLDAAAGGRWAMLVAHHLPTLILFGSEALFPRMLQLKYASRIMIIEISTPLLTRWRRSRRKSHFVQFMAVFFLVRVVYLSWLATQFEEEIGGWPASWRTSCRRSTCTGFCSRRSCSSTTEMVMRRRTRRKRGQTEGRQGFTVWAPSLGSQGPPTARKLESG